MEVEEMTIEQELVAAAKVSLKKGETRQAFLCRLVSAVDRFSNEKWESLTLPAQSWVNKGIKSLTAVPPKAVDEFPDLEADRVHEESTEELSAPVADVSAPVADVSAPVADVSAPVAATAGPATLPARKVTPPKAAASKKVSASSIIRKLVITQPGLHVEKYLELAELEGATLSRGSAELLVSDTRATLKVLAALGKLI